MRTLESLLDDEFDMTDDDVLTLRQDHWYCEAAEMDGVFFNACTAVTRHEMYHGQLSRMEMPCLNFVKLRAKKPFPYGGRNVLYNHLVAYIKWFMIHASANKDSVERTIRDFCGDKVSPLKIDFKESTSGGRRKIIIKATVTANEADAMYGNDPTGMLRVVFIQLKH